MYTALELDNVQLFPTKSGTVTYYGYLVRLHCCYDIPKGLYGVCRAQHARLSAAHSIQQNAMHV